MRAEDVEIVVTNCYRPAWTERGVASIRRYYPKNRIVIIDDCCIECGPELAEIQRRHDAELVLNPKRVGCGRALDVGMRETAGRWVLTFDHGVTLEKPGVIELLLEHTGDDVGAAGRRGGNNKCGRRFGPYVLCGLGLWDREFIVANDLTFKLSGIFLPDGTLGATGCSTGAYLCYRLQALDKRLAFVRFGGYYHHEHSRDTFGRKFPSPHEPVHLEEGEIDTTLWQEKRRRGKGWRTRK